MKGTYSLGAPIPSPSGTAPYPQVCELNGKIYCVSTIGMYLYDPITNRWTALDDKVKFYNDVVKMVAVENSIYIMQARMGSQASERASWIYNIDNNTWSGLPAKPNNQYNCGIAVVGEKIYCIGGMNSSGGHFSFLDIFDTKTKTWTTGEPVPYAVAKCACVVHEGKIHCLGGRSPGALQNHYSYDITSHIWAEETPIPVATEDLYAILLQNKICYIDGRHRIDNFYVYNTIDKIWEIGPNSPITFLEPRCAQTNEKLYLFECYGNGPVATEIFTPEGSEPGQEPEPPVTSGVLRLALRKGQSQRLVGLQLPQGVTLEGLTWESGNPGIATVSDVGMVTGVSLGLATIIATAGDKSWSGKILVQVCGEDERLSILLEVGESCQLLAWGDGGAVTWVSGKEAVATVSTTGQVLAVSAGVTPITATDSHGRMDTLYVKVEGAE